MTVSLVQAFKSNTEAYHQAFQTFLDHTDQKVQARKKLDELVCLLKNHRIFIDAGAGNGKVTAWLTDTFARTIALEPNPSLRLELSEACPQAEVLSETITEARIQDKADFILSSHVFYYIPSSEWIANLERLVSWLAPQGILTVIIQNSQSDCMRMLRHFLKQAFDLNALKEAFSHKLPESLEVSLDTIPSHITTPDLEKAYRVAEFMLNLLPLPEPPASHEVREYVLEHFKLSENTYQFSCSQDFLTIRRRD